MEGMSGPALYHEGRRRGHDLSVIFITANHDEVLRPRC